MNQTWLEWFLAPFPSHPHSYRTSGLGDTLKARRKDSPEIPPSVAVCTNDDVCFRLVMCVCVCTIWNGSNWISTNGTAINDDDDDDDPKAFTAYVTPVRPVREIIYIYVVFTFRAARRDALRCLQTPCKTSKTMFGAWHAYVRVRRKHKHTHTHQQAHVKCFVRAAFSWWWFM